MGERGRLASAYSSYYPTLDEVLSSTDDDLNKYLNKTVKGNVVSLFKELINRYRDNGTIKTEIMEMKQSLAEVVEEVQHLKEQPPPSKATYSEITQSIAKVVEEVQQLKEQPVPTKVTNNEITHNEVNINERSIELRVSGIPEFKSSHAKSNRSEQIDYEEKSIASIVKYLECEDDCIKSFNRLGKYQPNATRPRTLLVKFKTELVVNKILARANKLRFYEGDGIQDKYKVFISKSLSKTEQELENKLLKKRRELINEGNQPSTLRIRNFELFLNDRRVDLN